MARSTKYCPQLDAFRGIAICIVMLHHFFITHFFLSGFGVTIFFVLSGYFTTASLMGLRGRVKSGEVTPFAALRFFLMRKYLRIIPVYYILLLATVLLGVPYAREGFLWNAAFLTNFWMIHTGDWPGRFSPMWSLSIVEQFYLTWAVIVLLRPKWRLLPIALGAVAAAPLYRAVCHIHYFGMGTMYWFALPVADLDSLGCGVVLALCQLDAESKFFLRRAAFAGGTVCGPILLGIVVLKAYGVELPLSAIYIPLIASLFFLWLIHRVSRGSEEGFGWAVLNWRLLRGVGQMSYSVFLFHNFTELLMPDWKPLNSILGTDFRVLVLIPATIFFASFSWRFVEQPVLAWRDRFLQTKGGSRSRRVEPARLGPGYSVEMPALEAAAP